MFISLVWLRISFQVGLLSTKVMQAMRCKKNAGIALWPSPVQQESLTMTYSDRLQGWQKKPSRFLSEMRMGG